MNASATHLSQRSLELFLAAMVLLVGCNEPEKPSTAKESSAAKPATFEIDPAPPPEPTPEGMIWVPGGKFRRGSDYDAFTDARPIRVIEIDGFWMDETPVTNKQFSEFIKATGYVTMAERTPKAEDFPDAPPENLVPGSLCFKKPAGPVDLSNHYSWWTYMHGACWNHPEGPKSNIDDRMDHPVVHVCFEDTMAYAKWAGKRLPTESEWERASRGKRDQAPYVWGDKLFPDGKTWMANTWQGEFPLENDVEDGYAGTSPVKAFPPNDFGLYDMSGNVWQWCSDWYRPDAYVLGPKRNPQGPDVSYDPIEPGVKKRVQRGGSFLCSDSYCVRYRCGGRGKMEIESASAHVGFRCAKSAKAASEKPE
jgi:formylglycine-generating enzyme required for sulfatase activity